MVGAVERNSVTTLQGSLAQTHHQMRIGVLERHEERCVVDAMEKSGATVSSGKRSLERPGEPSVMDAVKEAELRL